MAKMQDLYMKLKDANVATFETMCDDAAYVAAGSEEGEDSGSPLILVLIPQSTSITSLRYPSKLITFPSNREFSAANAMI